MAEMKAIARFVARGGREKPTQGTASERVHKAEVEMKYSAAKGL
jgi:hypothetical protein